jgi:hypothetical protein
MKNIKYGFIPIIFIASLVFGVFVYAADSWPGDSGSIIGNATSLGFGYEPSGIVYHSGLGKLVLVGDDGDITTMNTDGSGIDTDHVGGDIEGITIANTGTDLVYAGIENPDSIKEFDISDGAFTGNQWDLTLWMTGDANQGLEALTFIPNGSHPYENSDSGGLFYAGLQADGDIYVFDVNLSTSGDVDYIGKITLDDSRTDISGLDYNTETGLLYAIFDSSNEILEINSLDNTIVNDYSLPGVNQEGISIVSNCLDTSANAYVAEDSGDVKVYGSYSITCLEEDEDDGDDSTDNTDDSSDSSDDSTDDSSSDDSSSDDSSTTPEDTTSRTTEEGTIISPKIITTSGTGETTHAQVYDRKGVATGDVITNLFPDSYTGGAGVVSIDSNNNGIKDQTLIFAINNGGPQARVIGIKENKSISNLGQMFVFDSSIRDGLSATSGDFDGDGYSDDAAFCLTGNRAPTVRVYYNVTGIDNWELHSEFTAPFGNVGCNVGTFQYDSGHDDILVTPNHGSADPNVYIYWTDGRLQNQFAAYGLGVQSGLTASGIGKRIYTTPNNGSSQINVFDRAGERKNFWWAYQEHIRGDYTNVAGDIDLDGIDELLVSPIGSNGPQVLAYEPSGKWRTWPNFFAFGDETLRNGVGIAVIDNYHGIN